MPYCCCFLFYSLSSSSFITPFVLFLCFVSLLLFIIFLFHSPVLSSLPLHPFLFFLLYLPSLSSLLHSLSHPSFHSPSLLYLPIFLTLVPPSLSLHSLSSSSYHPFLSSLSSRTKITYSTLIINTRNGQLQPN